jgi:hypothetical protein
MRHAKQQRPDADHTKERYPDDPGVVLDDAAVHASLDESATADHEGDPIVGIFYAAVGSAVLWAALFAAVRLLG